MRWLLIAIALLCSFLGLFAAVLWAALVWEIQTVDPTAEVRCSGSLALDANGYPHMSYCDWSNVDVKYAAWNGVSWDIEIVDSPCGRRISLALDAWDYPHISCAANGNLKYAAWNGASWDFQIVDAGGGTPKSLALDAWDHPHISYSDYANADLKYATAFDPLAVRWPR